MKIQPQGYTISKLLFSLIFFCLLACNFQLQAQVRPNLGGSSRLMSNAIQEMERGDFEKANSFFRQIIESNLPIPQEMPYFFAETLFELGQYDNSSNFLKKYLEINGFRGDNYESAKQLEKRLEQPLQEILTCQLCDRRGYRYEVCETCSGQKRLSQSCNFCRARGIVGCNSCKGSGLVTRRNIFNITEYYECERCSGQGKITCPRCEGTHVEFSDCRTCAGSGRTLTESLCDHQSSDKPKHLSLVFQRLQHKHP
jgi:DnaJ-class molecular chaperone